MFITRNSSLIQFVKQYNNCLKSTKHKERESDTADFYTDILCATKSSIEAQFQHVYTHAKFRKVQAQFRGKSALGYAVYEIVEHVSNSTFNKFAVTYDTISIQVKWQCLLFESRGILYCHFLSVLSFEQVNKISPRYILERWSKNVKRRHTHIKSSHDEPLLEPKSRRFDDLELTAILHRVYDNAMTEMQEYKAKSKGKYSLSHHDASLEDINELQSPPRIRVRGRPNNRLGPNTEKQIAHASKKKKDLTELNLFYSGSVVQSNFNHYHGYVMNYQFRDSVA
ncbi:hypothetical protein Ahy_B01g056269 isoform B [Arachis hypogaea]|uniref:Protein FAR1-RELATED SEQUENCE n=1 Tax=Arachis hypogaea TaxID=3818 RepID=A0A445AYG0_ARAHY|nr:hypothetical protein Ahy_B01g056269 isoform B [Arachis hypogaea]